MLIRVARWFRCCTPVLGARVEPARRISTKSEEAMGELIDKTKGKIKQAAGALTGDKKLEREGRVDTAKGNAKGAFEDVKQAVKGAPKK